MGWRFAGFQVAVFPESLGLRFLLPAFHFFVNECANGYQIRPGHLYDPTDRDKVSEWNCGI